MSGLLEKSRLGGFFYSPFLHSPGSWWGDGFLFSGEPLELMLSAEVLRPARGQPNSRTLDQHISKLSKLIEKDPQNPENIRTVHGVGYTATTPDPRLL